MLTSVKTHGSNLLPTRGVDAWNRTGGALEPGDVVAFDLTGSDGDVEPYSTWDPATDRDSAHPFRNVISVAAAHDDGWILAVATEAIADNASGAFTVCGLVDVKVADSLAIGARLSPTTATNLVGEADGVANCGILLEANSSGGVAARPALFNGICFAGPQSEV